MEIVVMEEIIKLRERKRVERKKEEKGEERKVSGLNDSVNHKAERHKEIYL